MDWFQAIPYVRECAANDHAHRVIEVTATHLVFEVDGNDFSGEFGHLASVVANSWPADGLRKEIRKGSDRRVQRSGNYTTATPFPGRLFPRRNNDLGPVFICLLYTSDAADERSSVD